MIRLVLAAMLTVPPYLACAAGADDAAVIAANKMFYVALSAHDGAAMRKLYAATPYVAEVHPSAAAPLVGQAALDRWAQGVTKSRLSVTPAVATMHVNGDTAWVMGTERVQGTLGNGTPIDTVTMFTNVFEKQDGAWRLVAHEGR